MAYTNPPLTKLQAARRARMMKLRAEGHTYQEIGDRLGVSRQRVHQLIVRVAAQQRTGG